MTVLISIGDPLRSTRLVRWLHWDHIRQYLCRIATDVRNQIEILPLFLTKSQNKQKFIPRPITLSDRLVRQDDLIRSHDRPKAGATFVTWSLTLRGLLQVILGLVDW